MAISLKGGFCSMKYSILILVCVNILLWKLIDVMPDIITAIHNRKSHKWTDSYFKDDNN